MASFLWLDLRFLSTTRPLSLTMGPTPTVLTLNPLVVAEGVARLQVPGLGAVCLSAPVIGKLGQFRTTVHWRWAVVGVARLTGAAGDGKSRNVTLH